jgi:GNAT superfamily N-acetyltransferase
MRQFLDRLPQILAFYEQHGARSSIEVSQCHLDEGLGRALHDAGFFPRDVYPIHYRAAVPGEPPLPPDGVIIRASPDAEIETWVGMFLEGFGLSRDPANDLLVRRRAWFLAPGFRRYIAMLDGEPAAVAGLFLHGETAILDPAATLRRARGRGLQQALIRHRLAEAAAAGCDLASVETGWATISHRNQQRAGFDVAFNRVVFSPAQSERT